jgi:hypothetical protein
MQITTEQLKHREGDAGVSDRIARVAAKWRQQFEGEAEATLLGAPGEHAERGGEPEEAIVFEQNEEREGVPVDPPEGEDDGA